MQIYGKYYINITDYLFKIYGNFLCKGLRKAIISYDKFNNEFVLRVTIAIEIENGYKLKYIIRILSGIRAEDDFFKNDSTAREYAERLINSDARLIQYGILSERWLERNEVCVINASEVFKDLDDYTKLADNKVAVFFENLETALERLLYTDYDVNIGGRKFLSDFIDFREQKPLYWCDNYIISIAGEYEGFDSDRDYIVVFIELDEEYFVINKNIATRGEQEHGLVWELVLDCTGDILWITIEDEDERFDVNELDKIIKMFYTEGNRFAVHEPYEIGRDIVV